MSYDFCGCADDKCGCLVTWEKKSGDVQRYSIDWTAWRQASGAKEIASYEFMITPLMPIADEFPLFVDASTENSPNIDRVANITFLRVGGGTKGQIYRIDVSVKTLDCLVKNDCVQISIVC